MSQYLLYSPGVQALLMWGGREAHDTVGTIAGLAVNQPRLHEVARTWHEVSRRVGAVAGALAADAGRTDWHGEAAEGFAAELDGHLAGCTALAARCRDIGDSLAAVAESMGQAHHALVSVTAAAGQALATLAPAGVAPAGAGNPTTVIVRSWRAVCEQLVRHSQGLLGSAAAALGG